MTALVLAVNAGSGTITVAAYRLDEIGADDRSAIEPVWTVDIVRHVDPARVTVRSHGRAAMFEADSGDHDAGLAEALTHLWNGELAVIDGPDEVAACGHRIVHGGPDLVEPTLITPAVLEALDAVSAMAPLHNPVALRSHEVAATLLPDAAHVAVFDTAFHHDLPPVASAYALPAEWAHTEIRRYGFHGISHRQASERAVRRLGLAIEDHRLITVHLGGGCSATAIRDGHSIATTMGFTPNDGMVMATRSGAIDPGIITYLQRRHELTPDEIDDGLNRRSGLLGLSGGTSGDVSALHDLVLQGDTDAEFAVDCYVLSAAREIATMRCSIERLDALVFTGSATEPWLVDRISGHVAFMGSFPVVIVPTDEEIVIAGAAAPFAPQPG